MGQKPCSQVLSRMCHYDIKSNSFHYSYRSLQSCSLINVSQTFNLIYHNEIPEMSSGPTGFEATLKIHGLTIYQDLSDLNA